MLVVPVPRPASLNEVVSAPVLLLTLLSAYRKCGLSAKAGVAAIATPNTADISTTAMRRMVLSSRWIPESADRSRVPRASPFGAVPNRGWGRQTIGEGKPLRDEADHR